MSSKKKKWKKIKRTASFRFYLNEVFLKEVMWSQQNVAFGDGQIVKCTFTYLFMCLCFYLFAGLSLCVWWCAPKIVGKLAGPKVPSSQLSWCFSQSGHQLTSSEDPTTRNNKGVLSVLVCSFHIYRKGHYTHPPHFTKWPCFMRPKSTSVLYILPYHNFHFLTILIHFFF